jgi:hypothetical protein
MPAARFGGDLDVGKTINLDGYPMTLSASPPSAQHPM